MTADQIEKFDNTTEFNELLSSRYEQITINKHEDGMDKRSTTNTSHDDDDDDDDEFKQTEMPSSLVPLSQRCDSCKSKEYDTLMKILEEFQSQSKWQKHQHLTSICLKQTNCVKERNPDFKVVLYLEQGMAEVLQKKFSLAKRFFRDALRLCEKSNNVLLLRGRALMFLGNTYRKEGPRKYGKALKYLTLAQQNLSLVEPGEDRAELNYFLGAFHLNLLSISGREPSQKSRERIEKYYEAVYEFAMLDPASRVHERIQKMFPLGMANFLLDGQTETARSRIVADSKLKRAEDCLNHFCDLYPFDEQAVSLQTDYLKSKSDLEYRHGNFINSQKLLEQGLVIAKAHGYNLEVQSLENRLALLQKSMPNVTIVCPQEETSHFADHSSSVDSEINVFCSGSE